VADELCFWRSDEDSSNPDRAIIDAIRPTLATTKGPLALISSPYARRGVLFDMFTRYYGKTDDPAVLVAHGPTKLFNSSLSQKVIDRAYEHDPISAAAEYGGEWRTDVENFLTREIIDSCVVPDRHELPFIEGVHYHAFVDPSGGVGDSFALAIAHAEGDLIVLDLLRERKSPLNPEVVIAEFADTLADYHIHSITGDHYGGLFPRQEFAKHGITYKAADKSKSEFYQALLPMLNSGKVQLLDNKRLITQLISLERRTARGGRDSIDHPPGAKDDVANAIAGAIVSASKPPLPQAKIVVPFIVGSRGVISDPSRAPLPAWHNFSDPWPFRTHPTLERYMTTVEDAQNTLADLTSKREAHVAHMHELDHGRQKVAFKAHTGSKAERAKLDHINKEALTQEYELRSLDSAITEATTRLAEARRQEALLADRAQAEQLRSAVDRFVQHGNDLDRALQQMAAHGKALRDSLNEIHNLGSPFPSHAQLDALGALAMKAALMATTWKHAFETVPPKDRHNFADLVNGWAQRIEENSISPRLQEVA
jgi:hypothetical protein